MLGLTRKKPFISDKVDRHKRRKRYLLGQLVSYGDCLYATAIARQIKNDFPGCHLTWAIGSMCRSILDENPYVDEIWEVPIKKMEEVTNAWQKFESEAKERKRRGEFDEIFLTQIAPANLHNYDGTIRSSTFRNYPYAITVPIAPVIRLTEKEVENVRRFAKNYELDKWEWVILFECSPKSGQSFVTPEFAIGVVEKVIKINSNVLFVLSSNNPIQSSHKRVIDGSVLTFRENAELTKYCSLLVGSSSGISWLATSDWAKPIPMIQLLRTNAPWFASVVHDYEYFGLETSSIIEMSETSTEKVSKCITTVVDKGFEKARLTYHERLNSTFELFDTILYQLLRQKMILKAFNLFYCNIRRHGLKPKFIFAPLKIVYKVFWDFLAKIISFSNRF